MKKNKVVLPLIIFLLLCFLPCSVYGLYSHIVFEKERGNLDHLHKFENKLYYYDNEDKLIGVYECQTDSCDDAIPVVDDEYLKYYEGVNTELGVFGDEYVFIQDGDAVKLYSVTREMTILEFAMIKNYGLPFNNDGIIIKDLAGKYGLFSLDSISFIVVNKYDFMGLAQNFDGAALDAKSLVVKENGKWFVVDTEDVVLTEKFTSPIYSYDKDFVYLLLDDNTYAVHYYGGERLLSGVVIKKIDNAGSYHVIVNGENNVVIYDNLFDFAVKSYGEFGKSYDYRIEENVINIYEGQTLIDTFDPYAVEESENE